MQGKGHRCLCTISYVDGSIILWCHTTLMLHSNMYVWRTIDWSCVFSLGCSPDANYMISETVCMCAWPCDLGYWFFSYDYISEWYCAFAQLANWWQLNYIRLPSNMSYMFKYRHFICLPVYWCSDVAYHVYLKIRKL